MPRRSTYLAVYEIEKQPDLTNIHCERPLQRAACEHAAACKERAKIILLMSHERRGSKYEVAYLLPCARSRAVSVAQYSRSSGS